jgi:hypothetical protein
MERRAKDWIGSNGEVLNRMHANGEESRRDARRAEAEAIPKKREGNPSSFFGINICNNFLFERREI